MVRIIMLCASVIALGYGAAAAAASADPLVAGFTRPPSSAGPRVWWDWLGGNISKDGITKDFAWLQRIGIVGVNQISLDMLSEAVTQPQVPYMSDGWKDDLRYAADVAGKYGMEFGIDTSAGWSETGGPSVTPQQAMKRLVWSTTTLEGGATFHGLLAQPPSSPGPLQNVPQRGGMFGGAPGSNASLNFYRDSAVVAYKETVPAPMFAKVTSSAGDIDVNSLSDGDLTNGPKLQADKGAPWIEFHYAEPTQIEGATVAVSGPGGKKPGETLESSDDGATWKLVAHLSQTRLVQSTESFAPVTARYFRVTFGAAPPVPSAGMQFNMAPGAAMPDFTKFGPPPSTSQAYEVHELVLRTQATVNASETKAGFVIAPDYYALASAAPFAPGTAIDPGAVVDLTSHMQLDGTLDWTPPPGRWIVLRMGYSLEGTRNHPAPKEGTGLEVDKLNASYVRTYLESYLGAYKSAAGGRGGINALTADSTEVGMQNWTDDILSDFRRLRGYEPVPWLPTLTGVAVGSPEQSDKFLWDFRRTLDELLAKNHYGVIAEVARAHGLTNYGEAMEDHRPTFGDDMEMRQYTSIPMGAMWTFDPKRGPANTYVADLRGAASVAHIYGQNLVGAESMTSAIQPWMFAPRELKPIVDMEFVLGVNRIQVHSSVHQPQDNPPGISAPMIGQYFNRLESWAEEAGPWVRYLARCSYLLQQGRFAADIAYFYGQEAPITGLFGDQAIDVPPGYNFDFVNSDVIDTRLSVDHGALVTPSGMRYRLLYLGGSSKMMTVDVLRRIRDLVKEGGVVVGQRPVASPSLRDTPTEFDQLADEVFGSNRAERDVGAGKVFPSGKLDDALSALGLQPDFAYDKPEPDTQLLVIHRRLSDGDVYFISNRTDHADKLTASFRVVGRIPEVWDAVTGRISAASYEIADGRTKVSLDLASYGSIFVVFRKRAMDAAKNISLPNETTLATLDGPWAVAFEPDRGAPPSTELNALDSWSQNPDAGIKYFSGTGTYSKSFILPAKAPRSRILLDLGDVYELAGVTVNGKDLGQIWTPPFKLDVTAAVHPGTNTLVVKVTNLWVNRLIGDQQPGAKKFTFTVAPTYQASAPLRTSGLLGPVRVLAETWK